MDGIECVVIIVYDHPAVFEEVLYRLLLVDGILYVPGLEIEPEAQGSLREWEYEALAVSQTFGPPKHLRLNDGLLCGQERHILRVGTDLPVNQPDGLCNLSQRHGLIGGEMRLDILVGLLPDGNGLLVVLFGWDRAYNNKPDRR